MLGKAYVQPVASGQPKDFLISSVYLVQGRALNEQDGADHRALSPEVVVSSGPQMIEMYREGSLYDITKIQQGLRQLISGMSTPVQRGILIDRTLEALPDALRAPVALGVLYSLRDQQLEQIGRGGLHALWEACRMAEYELHSGASTRLLMEFERRGQVRWAEVSGVTLIADDGVDADSLTAARIRYSMHPQGLSGKVVVLTSHEEAHTDASLLLEHIKRSARALPSPLRERITHALASNTLVTMQELQFLQDPSIPRGWSARFMIGLRAVAALPARLARVTAS